MSNSQTWHGTTILGVRKDGKVVVAGDGQVSLGQTVIKPNARKVRRLGADGKVVGGFAGSTADAFTPVSYTHLDVYKRQALWCGTNSFWVRR